MLCLFCVQENDAFFVMTNVVLTPKQKQGVCDEVTPPPPTCNI